eukprot:6180120-Pleurochrysis_carterae.AAC.1
MTRVEHLDAGRECRAKMLRIEAAITAGTVQAGTANDKAAHGCCALVLSWRLRGGLRERGGASAGQSCRHSPAPRPACA